MSQILKTQIRREFWEHRSLWVAPLVVAVLLLLSAVIGQVSLAVGLGPTPEQRKALFGLALWLSAMPEFVTLWIVAWMYGADCLYSERRDRSILFWKSMPVSDAQTVLSKLLVVGVIVPLGVYLLTLVTSLLICGLYGLRTLVGHVPGGFFWDTAIWLRMQLLSFEGLVIMQLWFAPVTAFLMLVSAWARRNVQLWVFLPALVAIVMERIVFGTHHLQDLLWYRLGGVFVMQANAVSATLPVLPGGDAAGSALDKLFASIDPTPVFGNIDLWLGLPVAAVFIVVAIRIRQYRDDT